MMIKALSTNMREVNQQVTFTLMPPGSTPYYWRHVILLLAFSPQWVRLGASTHFPYRRGRLRMLYLRQQNPTALK